jgi:hypothetical protein
MVTILLLVVGLALAGGGFLFFNEALYGLGLLAGLSVGLAAFTMESVPQQWKLVVLVAAPLVGLALAGSIKTLLVAVPGALMGAGVAIVFGNISITSAMSLADPIVVGGAVVGVILALLVETPILILLTASWGATLVSIALGGALLQPGVPIQESVTSFLSMTYWALFALGVLTQVGVWYYVRTQLDDGQSLKGVVLRGAGKRVGSLRN